MAQTPAIARTLALALLAALVALGALGDPRRARAARVTALSRGRGSGSPKLQVWQAGKRLYANKRGHIALAPRPFTLVVEVPRGRGVSLNVSSSGKLFARARAGRPLGNHPALRPGSGMAEHLFNRDEELFASDSGSHYLYVDTKRKEHRFSRYAVTGNGLRGYRRVKQIWNVDSKKRTPIGAWRGKDLYLVARLGTPQKERWRAYVRLRFNKR